MKMKANKKQYIVTESKNTGKNNRYHVVDTLTGNLVRGQLDKERALGLEGFLNGKPHKLKDT